MPKKDGRRVQIKIKFEIKNSFATNQDPFPLFIKLHKYKQNKNTNKYGKLILINFEFNYPNYKLIKKSDPRRRIYKIRHLFGPD